MTPNTNTVLTVQEIEKILAKAIKKAKRSGEALFFAEVNGTKLKSHDGNVWLKADGTAWEAPGKTTSDENNE